MWTKDGQMDIQYRNKDENVHQLMTEDTLSALKLIKVKYHIIWFRFDWYLINYIP